MKMGNVKTLAWILVLFLAFPVQGALAQGIQGDPIALGNTMVAYMNANNKDGLKTLIYPEIVASIEKTDPAIMKQLLNSWISVTVPEGYKISQKPVGEISEYDAASQTLNAGGTPMFYPIAPSNILVILAEKETTVTVDGKKQIQKVPTPMFYGVKKDGGKFYIVIPATRINY